MRTTRSQRRLAVIVLLICRLPAYSETLTVGHGEGFDHQTIAAALVASAWGDTILVAAGIYSSTSGELFPLEMKSGVTLISEAADSQTHILGDCVHSVFASEDVDSATVAGFKISSGSATRGGGIYIISSTVAMIDCSIMYNQAQFRGGGIYAENASTTLERCTISSNESVPGGHGGGMYCSNSVLSLRRCTVSDNSADGTGGIVHLGGITSIHRCTISGNRYGGFAGGGTVCMEDSWVVDNEGRGVACSGSLRIARCVISRNVGINGGGIDCGGENTEVLNCLISENVSLFSPGGGIMSVLSSPSLENCTIVDNQAESGGGVFSAFDKPALKSCILWGNTPEEISFDKVGDIDVFYSTVEDGWEGVGNIDVDPLFVDPAGGDFRLQADSPCIDSASVDGPATDILGNPRPIDIPGVGWEGPGAFDMGAYEFQPPIIQDPQSDINEDGIVNAMDLLILLRDWQKVTGP